MLTLKNKLIKYIETGADIHTLTAIEELIDNKDYIHVIELLDGSKEFKGIEKELREHFKQD